MTDDPEASLPPGADSAADVFERITDAVFALDGEWRFTYLNERAEEVLRREEAELVGAVIWEAFPAAVDSSFEEQYRRAMAEQEPVTFEEYYEPLNTWFDVHAYPSETGLSVYFRDITDRVRQEVEMATRERAMRDAYEVIADPELDFSEQVDALLDVVRTTIGTDYGALSHVDVEADEYLFEAVDAPPNADLSAGDEVALEATNCERVVADRQTLVINDVVTERPDLADKAGNADWGISSYLGAPVTVDGEVYGTFCFYDTEPRREEFTEWEVAFVDLLSNWVSAGIERRRRAEQLRASNERLERFAYAASHDLQEPLRMVSSYRSARRMPDPLGSG